MLDDWRKTIPVLTRDQMVDVDRAMTEDFGIELLQMMEVAGLQLARLARDRFLAGDAQGQHVVVLAGVGGNGGGGLVAARRLAGWGASVEVVLMRSSDEYAGIAAHQLAIATKLGSRVAAPGDPPPTEEPAVILDAMIGYGLRGRLKPPVADAVRWVNAQTSPVLSLDVPSGMDATSGEMKSPSLKATATLTLALPKTGLSVHGAEEFTGALYLADIGVPDAVYRTLGIDVSLLFARSDLLRLS